MATANLSTRQFETVPTTAAERAAARADEPTIGKLVHDALQDVSSLVRSEIQLAKSEITADVRKGGKGAAFFVVAAVAAFLGVIFFLHTFARLIAVWLPVWAGYLIVALVLFAVAGVCALLGKSQIDKVKGKPERAITTSRETVEIVKAAAAG
ncbi:hypothetical protein KEM60_01110 [Austwickia sp. TVS 96-490-7B]|uniref:phage holin family protein n=1 Tax=Austwickia sp. TVS 96-490-7B TaxID=2830843 RepID=UPI001C56021D|nr:phage holin family protein [Austwickia sp. TVS 96-490-7B]MBW3084920.1 hypothetical protein [Austwickia sp. TVS 96-490-7B]